MLKIYPLIIYMLNVFPPALLAPTRVLTVLIDNLLWMILLQKIMKLSTWQKILV